MYWFSILNSGFILIGSTTTATAFLFSRPQLTSAPAPRHHCAIPSPSSSSSEYLSTDEELDRIAGNSDEVDYDNSTSPSTIRTLPGSSRKYDTAIIADHNFRRPTSENLQTIQERQVFHALAPEQVFCASSRLCRHGHPQAFGFHPTRGPKLSSGLFRLSCPLLCEAIDAYEGEGGVRQMSDWLRSEDLRDGAADAGWKRRGYEEANAAHKDIRQELAQGDRDKLVARMGEYNADAFTASGVAGIPPGQTFNVKCVHAHVADHLCRREGDAEEGEGGNVIGKHALQVLEARGVPTNGSDVCWQQCNVEHRRVPSDWGYLAKKNRAGLRRRGSNAKMRNFQPSPDR